MKYTPGPSHQRTFLSGGLPAWLSISALSLVGSISCNDPNQSNSNKTTLLIARAGSGGGTITSMPEGINCGTICTITLAADTEVTLTAAPDAGSDFIGWSGDCTGSTTTCKVTLNSGKQVSARFEQNPLGPRVCTHRHGTDGTGCCGGGCGRSGVGLMLTVGGLMRGTI